MLVKQCGALPLMPVTALVLPWLIAYPTDTATGCCRGGTLIQPVSFASLSDLHLKLHSHGLIGSRTG